MESGSGIETETVTSPHLTSLHLSTTATPLPHETFCERLLEGQLSHMTSEYLLHCKGVDDCHVKKVEQNLIPLEGLPS